jgi:hydroxymethylpyrimidine pyrophosphatase-like HAD family hydrolase
MDIAIDFDGTVVTHDYPKVGKDIGSVPVLKKLIENGHKLILFTMRSGRELSEAVEWFKKNEVELHGIQYNPSQASWTSSNKCYAQMYIDDAALGSPLKLDMELSNRPFIDWKKVEIMLFTVQI